MQNRVADERAAKGRAAEELQRVAAETASEEQRAKVRVEVAAERKIEAYIDELRGMSSEEACQQIDKSAVRHIGATAVGKHKPGEATNRYL